MRSDVVSGAPGAPSPEILRRARVLGRVNVSDAVAGVLAGIAFLHEGRDHAGLLVEAVTERCGAAGGR